MEAVEFGLDCFLSGGFRSGSGLGFVFWFGFGLLVLFVWVVIGTGCGNGCDAVAKLGFEKEAEF